VIVTFHSLEANVGVLYGSADVQ